MDFLAFAIRSICNGSLYLSFMTNIPRNDFWGIQMSTLNLPKVPDILLKNKVAVWSEPVVIDTYEPLPADKNPMFLERRVYQGSSGKVYPMPFFNRISETVRKVKWDAVHIENRYLRLMILPQIGGRIHIALDKTNGYDFVYRQNVIKPALVGLAGPWISGGIEFNWPQHHRPGTYMPTSVSIENADDGSCTVWLSEHDPLNRLKGMHGVCIYPDKAIIELKVRLYNRTPITQTFLWWANVATRVNEYYQSFFPPDVSYVADHAKRAMCRFPLADRKYYGVDYKKRAEQGVPANELPRNFIPKGDYKPNDLSWYANIPVPTSYMAMGSSEDFFGGYDHSKQAGIVHVADHHIAPGKKQWTWGNHEFGYAWDRNLTDSDGPYIELMAGIFTDNQPDFAFLLPCETKTFSQYWYPIQKVGPAVHASIRAAVNFETREQQIRIGVSVTEEIPSATVIVSLKGTEVFRQSVDLAPGKSFVTSIPLESGVGFEEYVLNVIDSERKPVITYQPKKHEVGEIPHPATEPPVPSAISSVDELYITGLHLNQYRHATRSPVEYWEEALKRDPLDSRCNTSMAFWHYRRGEFTIAEKFVRAAIERWTKRNPNPADGESYYLLGQILRQQERYSEAYDAYYKAIWNSAWKPAGFFALAEIAARNQDWELALEHLDQALAVNVENLKARDLKVLVLRKLGRHDEASQFLLDTLKIDPLDSWALWLHHQEIPTDCQSVLDIAIDMMSAGLYEESLSILNASNPEADIGVLPLFNYYRAYVLKYLGMHDESLRYVKKAAMASPLYCFPARLEEIAILESAIETNPGDGMAHYYLGNLFYDRRRYHEAIDAWEECVVLCPSFPTAWRNLGIAYFNVNKSSEKAVEAYANAVKADHEDIRLLYEQDQLWKRIGILPEKRIGFLEQHERSLTTRDDLLLEYCSLLNQVGRHGDALRFLTSHRFQPWEGGEGLALGQYVRTHVSMGKEALRTGNATEALKHFEAALVCPENIGEAKHLLANQSDLYYWLGEALASLDDIEKAKEYWTMSAEFEGDFQDMAVKPFSEMTFFQAMSLKRLGKNIEAMTLLDDLAEYAKVLDGTAARIDYFATSLPTMLLFEDDLQMRQKNTSGFLLAQAMLGEGKVDEGLKLLEKILQADPNHQFAKDFLEEWIKKESRGLIKR